MKPIQKLTKALCAAMREKTNQVMSLEGSIAIEVGHGDVVTVRFGRSAKDCIEQVFDNQSDLLVWFAPDAFEGFLDGTLDAELAMDNSKIILGGDIKLLKSLSLLLDRPMSMLALRAG